MENRSERKSARNHSLGSLVKLEKNRVGLTGDTDNGAFEVTVYSEGIFRVRILKEWENEPFSYAVTQKPDSPSFSAEELNDSWVLSTDICSLEISKNPVRFVFKTKEGVVINEDDPSFGTSWIGEQATTYKKLQKGERFIGLGEKTGPLDRKGKGYVNWNTDHFAYGPESDPLYCSIPFYMGIHRELAYGIFLDNPHKSFFNFGASNDRFASFSADMGEMNYYFIYGNEVKDIIREYTWLTGRMSLPPLWSLGYQQCRYSYYPESEVQNVADTFRVKDIPADTIVLDIHYMDQYKIFTFDNERFPDPAQMIKKLEEKGFKVVVIFDPGIKIEKGYGPYEEGLKEDVFVKYPDGEPYSGEVWPGWCHFPDFSKKKTREWWSKQMQFYADNGITGFWNDMNEIATWGQYLPELMEMDFDGNPASMRKGRNLYGLLMAKSTYEGARKVNPNVRPFNLTRSGFAGIQRYAAVWTGDNVANDEHMLTGVRLVNSLGLSGVAFTGYDVGGFAGNANENLFARWIQLGAFSPFFRGHSMINSRDSEPWAFGEEVEDIARNFIKLRYKLLMYLYSLMHEATQSGIPVARSMAIYHTHDENVYSSTFQNQYYFGEAFLVAPVESWKDLVKIYLPEGEWYDFYTDKKYEPGVHFIESSNLQLPVFVKASAIYPVSPNVQQNSANLGDTLEYHIYAGPEDNSYTYYEDDGETYNYEKNEDFIIQKVDYTPENNSISIGKPSGNGTSRFKNIEIVLHGFDGSDFRLNETKVVHQAISYKFIEPVSNFDPFGNESGKHLKIEEVIKIKIKDTSVENIITW